MIWQRMKTHSCCRRPKSVVKAGLRLQAGQALVEVALVAPILVLLLIGAVEFGRLEYASIEVNNAARAGAQYGSQTPVTAMDFSGMQQAAINDAPDVLSLTATTTNYCSCPVSNSCSSATQAACTPGMCSGTQICEYVQVNTQAVVDPLFHYPGLPTTFTLQGQSTMRVGQ